MNILYIAYYFPPIGGAGTQRSTKFVKYLPQFGVHPLVLTGTGPTDSRWEPEDPSLLDEIPASVTIHRPDEPGPASHSGYEFWVSQIIEMGMRAAAVHAPSVILVTVSPYEALEPSLALGRLLGLPVVADLRDPWALDEVKMYRSRFHRFWDRRAMGSALTQCTRIVMNTQESARAVLDSFPNVSSEKVSVIPNGYDAPDFSRTPPSRDDDRFQVVHTGYLHTGLARSRRRYHVVKRVLGGSMWDINLEARSHVYLLRALELLLVENPEFARNVEIGLAGVLSDEDREVISASAARDNVRQFGYLDHRGAVDLMRAADALFLPLHDVPSGKRSRIVPGKTYEYLASGTPVVAAVPQGDARDLINRTAGGVTVDPTDVRGIADGLIEIASNPDRFRVDIHDLSEFDRRHLTRDLAAVLRQARHEGVPVE